MRRDKKDKQDKTIKKGKPAEVSKPTEKAEPIEETEFERPLKKDKLDNSVYIGKKGTMNYVLACLSSLQSGSSEVILKARGKAISRAVDVLEICKNRFMRDQFTVEKIEIGTEQIKSEDRGTFSVSTIEITIKMK